MTIVLRDGWQYRWGDAPRDGRGLPAWAFDDEGSPGWSPLPSLKTPPGRDGATFLWERVRLPPTLHEGDTLYLRGVWEHFEMYVDGERVHATADLDAPAVRFEGTPFHIVKLSPRHAGKMAVLRCRSESRFIGAKVSAEIAPEADHLRGIVSRDAGTAVVAGITILLGVLTLALFVARRTRAPVLGFSLFALTYGSWLACRTQTKQIVLEAPLFWVTLEYFSLYLAPVGLALFTEIVVGAGLGRVFRWIRRVFLAYFVAAASAVALGLSPLTSTLVPFQIFAIVSTVLVIGHSVRAAWLGNRDSRLLTIGYATYMVMAGHDVAAASELLPWHTLISYVGALFFVVCLTIIVANRIGAESTRKAHLEKDLETASVLASTLLPASNASHAYFDLCAYTCAAERMGGDWFSYDVSDDGHLHLHLADVTGHGTPAALLAAYAKGATDMFFDARPLDGDAPRGLAGLHEGLQRLLVTRGGGRSSMTLFSLAVSLRTGAVSYVSSGHLPQFLLPGDGSRRVVLARPSPLLGIPSAEGDNGPRASAVNVTLVGDDLLFLCSDGLFDVLPGPTARDAPRKLVALLTAVGSREPAEVRDAVVRAITPAIARTAPPDDVTFLVVRLKRRTYGRDESGRADSP